ncbi:hypothetical protein Ciccas_004263 [Cichlidogyrus casuarinus]|uniref:Uncharacterized protein n=1 Tax=Cichlidogyrus casuarinus TaxID=1844966 RepID=A0ABD2QCU6_9PLAT
MSHYFEFLGKDRVEGDEKCKEDGNGSGGKRNVQWSDYKEVSVRHQVIGRYLDLTFNNVDLVLDSHCFEPAPSRCPTVAEDSCVSARAKEKNRTQIDKMLLREDQYDRMATCYQLIAKSGKWICLFNAVE